MKHLSGNSKKGLKSGFNVVIVSQVTPLKL